MASNLRLFLSLFKRHRQVLLHWERRLTKETEQKVLEDPIMMLTGGMAV